MNIVNERIKEQIELKKYSYREMERLTNISRMQIQRYAVGTVEKIPLANVQTIAKALGISSAYLMGWVNDPYQFPDLERPEPEESEISILLSKLTDEQKKQVLQYALFLLQQDG